MMQSGRLVAAVALVLALAAGHGWGQPAPAQAPKPAPANPAAPNPIIPPVAKAPSPIACSGTDLIAEIERQSPAVFKTFRSKADAIPNGDALLWSIAKPGVQQSFLFGTFHSADPSAIGIARSLAPTVAKTATVATELGDINESVVGIKLGLRMLMSKVRAGDLIGSKEERERIGSVLKSRNLDPAAAFNLPPWVLMVAVTFPRCELDRQRRSEPTVDKTVVEMGKKNGAGVVALESVEEQADAMESIDPKLAMSMVALLSSRKNLADDAFATLTARYRAHRPGDMIPLMEAAAPLSARDAQANQAFMVTIIEKRNAIMAKRAAPLLAKGGVLIAVGALHLIGEKGLVELLRRDGYTLTKVW